MQYNTSKNQLIIPEYGRHIQDMIHYAVSVEDRSERNKVSLYIIDVMGNLSPHFRDVKEFQHKLWVQLFLMSNFELDVDCPFDSVCKNSKLEISPRRLKYPVELKKYRYYGMNLRYCIDIVVSCDVQDKDNLIIAIANNMKKSYINWNEDVVDDSVILEHLYELSNGNIDVRNRDIELDYYKRGGTSNNSQYKTKYKPKVKSK
ncbi:DUF4290 domain-containing protein [Ichthyobacterium seriolicida]|uniref:DUF4290 domain-containing protein n=1 Tax=Ichthyobacterium seriolicida TaxID=242600 RepID=A0A1J1ECL1_9FLAO|nr:DUF4290 domain-containing protein [Ichthyobacterium seriolicida]BAV95248.1 hypothetical protein JBKA6_1235 [Ichthyobacterium seriolicida]